ncbi:DUF3418 domain-containing protein [Acinetobacter baumannii]
MRWWKPLQVYLRTLAKIDPEWILLAARDLLKYHYFEPHWIQKAGIINAYAQISLFGLIIESKRLVNFEKLINLLHMIFLRMYLTTEIWVQFHHFLKHNLFKLEEVERVEDKLRRRDLVVAMKKRFISSMRRKFLKKLRVVVVLKTGVTVEEKSALFIRGR